MARMHNPGAALPTYQISDVVPAVGVGHPCYVGTFEDTPDPDIQWPHRHHFYSLVWFTAGHGANVIDLEEYDIRPHRVFAMQPNQAHNWSYSPDAKGFVVVFDTHFVPGGYPAALANTVWVDLGAPEAALMQTVVSHMAAESRSGGASSLEALRYGVAYLLHMLGRWAAGSGFPDRPKPATLSSFAQLVAAHLATGKNVADYADMLCVSVEKLNSLCKAWHGHSPKALILGQKITEAKRLLYFTDLSVKEVAEEVGFADSAYFSRVFRQKTGQSPGEYRAKLPG